MTTTPTLSRVPGDDGTRDPDHVPDVATCGTCGRSWDDAVVTSCTPAPSARCPLEYDHADPVTDDDDQPVGWITAAGIAALDRPALFTSTGKPVPLPTGQVPR
jgi:hypothetical protein